MASLIADATGVRRALGRTGFEATTAALRRSAYIAMEIEDSAGLEVLAPFEAYEDFTSRVDRLWRKLSVLSLEGFRSSEYLSKEHQLERLRSMRDARLDDDPTIWALLLIHVEKVGIAPELPPGTPKINRLAYGLAFVPDYGIEALGLAAIKSERFTRVSSRPANDSVSAFIDFFLGKLDQRQVRTSARRKIELGEMEETAILALDFLKSTGEVYRGWLMAGFSFLMPYALAPELVAAGAIATTSGVRAATQAERVATYLLNATANVRAMMAIVEVGPPLFELAVTLGKVFYKRSPSKPLTPGEIFEVIMNGLGAIPSARLGYFLMGVSIASPFQATRDFMAWMIQGARALEARVAAAKADLDLTAFDSADTLVVDLD